MPGFPHSIAAAATGLLGLLVVGLGTACGGAGASTEPSPELDAAETPAGHPVDPAAFEAREEGPAHLRLTGPVETLAPHALVELVPRGPWPTESRPAQALLLVSRVDGDHAQAVVLGQRDPTFDLSRLEGRVVQTARMPLSKSATNVVAHNGRSVVLQAGGPEGVLPGDYFFVLGEPAEEAERLGSRIIALVQVREVTTAGAQAHVVHQMTDFAAGAVAIFAHHASLEADRPEARVLFARTRPDEAVSAFDLPALASAVFEYQAEFQFSNLLVEPLDAYIDPAAYDAPEQAQAMAPEDGFGVIVFGLEREDDFLYNITTYGAAPSLATTVGILPGGLPLPTPDGLEALSGDLAPSFVATAMTQRGEHAETIYFLEYCLRNRDIEPAVAFHLREHLALRYESIHRPLEGFWIMSQDIDVARELENPYAELNALSIREYLNRALGDHEAELADLDTFLDVAGDVLPDESLLSERLERSRVLGVLDREEEALDLIEEVITQAQRQQSLRWEVSADITRANLLFETGDIDAAIQAINDAMPDARAVGDSYPRYCHALLAQFFTEIGNPEQALANVEAALAYATTDNIPYSMATTRELAATLHFEFDLVQDALEDMQEAVRIYSELDQFEDSARAYLQMGFLEMSAALQQGDPALLTDAYDHLGKSAETYLGLADGRTASQALAGMGLVNALLRDATQASVNYGRAIELAQAYNDPEAVASAYARLAELQHGLGNHGQAQRSLQQARLWATTFELAHILADIDALERAMRDAI